MGPFSQARLWAGLRMNYVKIAQNDRSVTFSYMPNRFYFVLWTILAERALKFMKNNHFLVLLAVWAFSPKFVGKLMSGLY